MNNETKYVKLSELVNGTFEVQKVWGYHFEKWDDNEKKMIKQDRYFDGAKKKYNVDTDKGKLTLSDWQHNTLLGVVAYQGKADINGRIFRVKSNGKTGMEIRYYFDVVEDREKRQVPEAVQDILIGDDEVDEPVDLSDIPF